MEHSKGNIINRTFLFIVLISIVASLRKNWVSAQNGFFFTIPKVLREGDTSEFCLTTYSSNNTDQNVTISMINRNDPSKLVEVSDTYSHGEEKCNNFTVPEAESYELLLHNETDLLQDSVQVTVKAHSQITLIETDKPVYKPGQKVKFRILTIKSNHKPRKGKISSVYVRNPQNSRVKQFLDVDSQGIASLEFQLSKEAKLGKWQILVFLNETDLSNEGDGMVYFDVKEYVLPRFEVEVSLPSYLLKTDEVVEGKVCAKYTYGKGVQGFLDLKICREQQYYDMFPEPTECRYEFAEINGCFNFSVNMTELKDAYSRYGGGLKINATVTERGTGAVITASKQGPSMTTEEIKLTITDFTNNYFKPGLTYRGKVTALKPDGSPAAGELINVTITDDDGFVRLSSNFTTDQSGVVIYSMCGDVNENVTALSIMAKAMNYTSPPPGMYTPRTYHRITQWFSPSFSYIEIPRLDNKLNCGNNLKLKVPFTTQLHKDTQFSYQIISRGKVMARDNVFYNFDADHVTHVLQFPAANNCLEVESIPTVEVPNTLDDKELPPPPVLPPSGPISNSIPSPWSFEPPPFQPFKEPIVRSSFKANIMSSFDLDISVTSLMSPKFTLLVHHILPDGEVVADSMEFEVDQCFDNKVNMTFSKPSVLPGAKVNLKLEAEPQSVCGIGVVDKSVNLLGGDHQITIDKIFDKIEELSISQYSGHLFYSDRYYCENRVKEFTGVDNYGQMFSQFVDAKEAFKSSGLIVLTNLRLETRPCEVSYPYISGPSPNGGPGPDIVYFEAVPLGVRRNAEPVKDVRTEFPETWLWDLQIIGDNGTIDIPQTAPDTITSWVGNALCMNSEKGVGVSAMQTLTTFQPFFVHLNLPYAAVRGEKLPIMFTVHNYLEKCLRMQIRLNVGAAFRVHNAFRHRKPFCICAGQSHTARFYATPLQIGNLPITARARIIAGACNDSVNVDLTYAGLVDAVRREMFVKAEGVSEELTFTSYMCAKENETSVENFFLPKPNHIVKDSDRGEVKVIGDIMGPALTNLDNLVRMPTGCGEQNMVGFTPNIFVLKYLGSAGLLSEKIHDKAIKFMEIGYQRELNYRHEDGSYSAFGKSDEKGSVWLTAFVVKSFAQAKEYVYIDPFDIEQSVVFLRRSQAEDGCFIETGKVFSSYMMGGLGDSKMEKTNIALTSYVLIALLQAGVNANETVISEGFNCMKKEFTRVERRVDTYSLSVAAYAYTLYDSASEETQNVMKELGDKAKLEGILKYWRRDGAKPRSPVLYFSRPAPSAEVEMTAYALLAYLTFLPESEIVSHTHSIAMWLSEQRNPYGGFSSTQDTVIGLNALSEFALLVYDSQPTNANVTVSGYSIDKTFHVSDEADTKLLLQRAPITAPNRITVSIAGQGCALVQTHLRFNRLPQNLDGNQQGFHLKVMPRRFRLDPDRCDRRTINIAVGSRGNTDDSSHGMSLVVVKMVTSWAPMKDSLKNIESKFPVLGMSRLEYDEKENTITFYFDLLKRKACEFAIDVEQDREMAVSSPKAAQVSVINYYETEEKVVKSYTLKTICGTKAEIPLRPRPPVAADSNIPMQTRIDPPPFLPPRLGRRRTPRPPLPSQSSLAGVAGPASDSCPLCRKIRKFPVDFKDIICNSKFIYKTVAGRKGSTSLKVKQEMRSSQKVSINRFANYTMPADCECSLLTPPATKVFIMTSTKLTGKLLPLDKDSAITYYTKRMERELRKLKSSCPKDSAIGA